MTNSMAIPMTDDKEHKLELEIDTAVEAIPEINSTPIDAEFNLAAQELAEVSDGFAEDFLYHIKPNSRRNERIISFCLVYAADRFEYSVTLEGLMQNLRDGYSLEVAHSDFITTLVGGVINEHEQLDERIKPYLKNWKLERLGCCTRLILRMGLWELSQPGAIPSVVLNEAIELAKLFAEKDAFKFVNGILDEIVKKTTVSAAPQAEATLAEAVVEEEEEENQQNTEKTVIEYFCRSWCLPAIIRCELVSKRAMDTANLESGEYE